MTERPAPWEALEKDVLQQREFQAKYKYIIIMIIINS